MRLDPSHVTSKQELRHFTIRLLTRWVDDLHHDRIGLHLPRRLGLMSLTPGMHFHLRPELFLQISGSTTFEFPEETCRAGPNDLCLVSHGLPHRETVRPGRLPFYNLVIAYAPASIDYHLAHQSEEGIPAAFMSDRLLGADLGHLTDLLQHASDWHNEGDPAHRFAVKGALLMNLSLVLAALQRPLPESDEPVRVIRVRQLVMKNLSNPDLSVDWVSRRLNSSPDYLSRLFRWTLGKSLGAYITDQRMARARELLESSSLNVSEISLATGYTDASYFTRLFRQHNGVAPRSYRKRVLNASSRPAPVPGSAAHRHSLV